MTNRWLTVALLVIVSPAMFAQSLDKPTLTKYISSHYDPSTGGYRVDLKSPPGLRATSGAVRSLGYLGEAVPNAEKSATFVLSCYDRETGAFAEPNSPPTVASTSVGIIAAVELKIPEAKFPKAVAYLRANAKSFEDVRIGAAALEILKQKPDWIGDWITIADAQLNNDGTSGKQDGRARDTASVAAMKARLGFPVANKAKVLATIQSGQRADGGWGKLGEANSDFDSTYRVMRALMLLKEKPSQPNKLREWIATCKTADGGYATQPGQASSMSGVYYAAIVTKWLDGTK
jgi:hypothetical protein